MGYGSAGGTPVEAALGGRAGAKAAQRPTGRRKSSRTTEGRWGASWGLPFLSAFSFSRRLLGWIQADSRRNGGGKAEAVRRGEKRGRRDGAWGGRCGADEHDGIPLQGWCIRGWGTGGPARRGSLKNIYSHGSIARRCERRKPGFGGRCDRAGPGGDGGQSAMVGAPTGRPYAGRGGRSRGDRGSLERGNVLILSLFSSRSSLDNATTWRHATADRAVSIPAPADERKHAAWRRPPRTTTAS
jgi:hypothetical protein